jgi:putative hydrolase of the HAD superfamily
MIRAIIFDFFDVFRSDGYNRWLKKHGREREGAYLAASERHDTGEYSDQQFFQAVSDASGESVEEIEYEMESGNEFNQELVDYVAGALRNKYKIALLSNASSEYLRNELAKYDVEKYFDEIIISSEVGLIKPSPEAFEYAVHKLAVEAEECVFVDDNPKHVAAAGKLGIHGVVYTDVTSLKKELEGLLHG